MHVFCNSLQGAAMHWLSCTLASFDDDDDDDNNDKNDNNLFTFGFLRF